MEMSKEDTKQLFEQIKNEKLLIQQLSEKKWNPNTEEKKIKTDEKVKKITEKQWSIIQAKGSSKWQLLTQFNLATEIPLELIQATHKNLKKSNKAVS